MDAKRSALDNFNDILKKAEGKQPLFFLDYDGTLTPIVSHPKDALLSPETKQVLNALGTQFFTTIVTGRGLDDIDQLIDSKELALAASHGFQLKLSQGNPFTYPDAIPYQTDIKKAYDRLCDELSDIAGIFIEYKVFSTAVHDRNVQDKDLNRVQKVVETIKKDFNTLKLTHGKRVYELRPNLDWDKGKAILWLIENTNAIDPIPIVIGDDLTDEDAFLAVKDFGITISVQNSTKETKAEYTLKDSSEVIDFLKLFQKKYKK